MLTNKTKFQKKIGYINQKTKKAFKNINYFFTKSINTQSPINSWVEKIHKRNQLREKNYHLSNEELKRIVANNNKKEHLEGNKKALLIFGHFFPNIKKACNYFGISIYTYQRNQRNFESYLQKNFPSKVKKLKNLK